MSTKPFVLLALISSIVLIVSPQEIECPRHRKPWHLISNNERMQFINGFQTLRSNGILSIFCETHRITDNHFFMDIHHTSAWLFWHSYFVWEIETQIRNIGDEYKCFSMPYWDVTNDAKYITPDYLPILDSLLGTDGNPENNHCVEDNLWNINKYTTEFLCTENEISPNCCLKRERNPNHHCPNTDDIFELINLKRFKDFQTEFDILHADIHKIIARSNASHMWSYNAPEDPLFVLFHSFIDYIRAMRQDCFNFDQISIDKLDEYIPFVYDNFVTDRMDIDGNIIDAPTQKYTLDTTMPFALIAEQEWAYTHSHILTPRMMFDISFWNISFELGSFWYDNDELQAMCYDNLNDTWFYSVDEYDYDKYEQTILDRVAFVDKSKELRRRYNVFMYSGVVLCVIALFIWICNVKIFVNRQMRVKLKLLQSDYGSVNDCNYTGQRIL